MKFGVFIYDDGEPIDLATYGVLSMARRVAPTIELCTIAPKAGVVRLCSGLRVVADYGIHSAPECDVLIVTGGPGWEIQANNRPNTRLPAIAKTGDSPCICVYGSDDTCC